MGVYEDIYTQTKLAFLLASPELLSLHMCRSKEA